MKSLFFVYGTLKKGYGNHRVLGNSTFIGEAISVIKYELYNGGFPLAYRSVKGLKVKGELYCVLNEKVVQDLDRLEGNGHFYTRALRDFEHLPSKKLTTAWIYEIPNQNYRGALCGVNKEHNAYEWSR